MRAPPVHRPYTGWGMGLRGISFLTRYHLKVRRSAVPQFDQCAANVGIEPRVTDAAQCENVRFLLYSQNLKNPI